LNISRGEGLIEKSGCHHADTGQRSAESDDSRVDLDLLGTGTGTRQS